MADRSETPALPTSQASNILTTKVDPTSARFEANMRFLADLMSQVRNEGEKICEGGGAKAIENQHAKGRLTARERIELLIDPGTFFELGIYAAYGMYEEWGGAAAAGVITGIGASSDALGDDHRERCHGEGWRVFPDDLEEGDSRPEHRHREPHPHHLSGRFGGRVSCRCRKMFFPTPTISAASSATTPSCRRWAFRRSPPSWACAWLAADTCQSCATTF